MTRPAGTGPAIATGSDLGRWAGSLACVLALHGVVLAGLAASTDLPAEPSESLPAVLIDLSPPPAAPSAAPNPSPPSEAVPDAAQAEPVLDMPPDTPVPDVSPPPTPIAVAEAPPEPVQVPTETPRLPPLPEPPPPLVEPVVALPAPPKPAEPPKAAKPLPRPVEKKAVQPPRAAPQRQAAPVVPRQRPAAEAGAQTTASIPSQSSGSSAAARSSWQGAIVAALNRAKRPQGESGLASVRFAIDRGGRVLSASLAGSAGSSTLDGEAVSLVRRASIPPAPSEVAGATFTFTVPIRFSSR